MENISKKAGLNIFKICMFLAVFTPGVIAYSSPYKGMEDSCPTPSGISISGKTSTSISFDWADSDGAEGYNIRCIRKEDSHVIETNTSNSAVTFNGLGSGTYTFYFRTNCGAGFSDYVITDEIIF